MNEEGTIPLWGLIVFAVFTIGVMIWYILMLRKCEY